MIWRVRSSATGGARRDLRRHARARADHDLRQPGLDRGVVPGRPAGRLPLRAGAARGLGGGHGHAATRSAAASPPSCSCTPPPGSATRWPRWPPRASTGRRWWCWSASRTGAISPTSRSSPGGCDGLAGDYPVSVDAAGARAGRARRRWRGRGTRRARARARARDRADGRLARARPSRTTSWRRRRACCAARAADPAAVAELAGTARGGALAGAGGGRGRRLRGDLGRAGRAGREARLPGLAGVASARAPASRRTTRRFAGHLPAGRAPAARRRSAGHDLVLVVGAAVFRQYPYEPGPFVERRARGSRS